MKNAKELSGIYDSAAKAAPLEERLDHLTEREAQIDRHLSQWIAWQTGLNSAQSGYDRAREDYQANAAKAHELTVLSDAIRGAGDNTYRMRLVSYALTQHLEQVVAAANERLDTMSDGRYQLRHSDHRAKGGGRSGLGLVVADSWTGRERDTATLSGGEAFMASLALALGLADAIRLESGGLELQTLFVDEGFGSLDTDTLEQVMDVLDGLREGGRLVGVVSHVTEMRDRIPCQITVTKTSEGSTLTQKDA